MSASHVELSTDARAASRPPFDRLTIALHWLTLVLILGVIGTALLRESAHDSAARSLLLQVHRSIGVVIWVVTALRLGWRSLGAQLPPFPGSMSTPHRLAVRASEYGLYALLLLQPATGMAQTILRGRAFDLFAVHIPVLLAKNAAPTAAFHHAHEVGAWCFIALASAHAAAALVHHFNLHDDVLQTMAPALLQNASAARVTVSTASGRLPSITQESGDRRALS